jgi:hypothetical protein
MAHYYKKQEEMKVFSTFHKDLGRGWGQIGGGGGRGRGVIKAVI